MIYLEVNTMLINEVCKECRLTKKAIEYYEEQGLICPQVLENGYRDFSVSEIEQLKKIAILRKLGLSVSDIKMVLNDKNKSALYNVSTKKALEIETIKSKQELAQRLAQNQDWEYTRLQLEILKQKQTISERLLNVFPGYYGKYVSLHFALYLNEPIVNEEQQEAFETIISFLDNVDLKIPVDLQEYLDEITLNFDASFVVDISDNMNKAIQNPEQYIADNQEMLEQYMEFKQSDEYKKSSAYKLHELFATFHRESGYYEIFIPAMKRLSQSYREYHEALKKADEVFIKKYPNEIFQQ